MMVVADIMRVETMAGIMVEITATIIERKSQPDPPMRYWLLILAVIPLLAANGCSMFSSSRNTANDRDHPGNGNIENHVSGMQHGDSQ